MEECPKGTLFRFIVTLCFAQWYCLRQFSPGNPQNCTFTKTAFDGKITIIIGLPAGRQKGRGSMKGYNEKRRKLFIRITAAILGLLMIASVFSPLIFR